MAISITEYDQSEVKDLSPTALLTHDKPVTVTSYDAVGNVETVTDNLGRTTKNHYDDLDRVIHVDENYDIQANGYERRSSWEYDAQDNLRKQSAGSVNTIGGYQPHSVQTTFEYDVLNRQTKVIQASTVGDNIIPLTHLTPKTELFYDAADNRVKQTDALGAITVQVYDELQRLTTTIEACGNARTTIAYQVTGTGMQRSVYTGYDLERNMGLVEPELLEGMCVVGVSLWNRHLENQRGIVSNRKFLF